MRWRCPTPATLCRPVPKRCSAPKHECVDILTQDRINDALSLEDRAFGFGFTWGIVVGEAKELEQGFCGLGEGRSDVSVRLVVPLEGWAQPAVEDEKGIDVKMQKAGEAIV